MNVQLFEDEIRFIDSEEIRHFVRKVLEVVDASFETMPTSTSGKHHPPECNTEGGLIKHVKRTCTFASLFMAAHQLPEKSIHADILIASLLLHDIGKREKYAKYWDYVNHPIAALSMIKPFESLIKNTKVLNAIKGCILYHMGPWTPKSHKKPMEKYNLLELVVYYSDYMASKKEIKFVTPEEGK